MRSGKKRQEPKKKPIVMTKAQIEKLKREVYYEASKSISLLLSMTLRDKGHGRDDIDSYISLFERYCSYVFEKQLTFKELEDIYNGNVTILKDGPQTRKEHLQSLDAGELGYFLCQLVTQASDSCSNCPFGHLCKVNENGAVKWVEETYNEQEEW